MKEEVKEETNEQTVENVDTPKKGKGKGKGKGKEEPEPENEKAPAKRTSRRGRKGDKDENVPISYTDDGMAKLFNF